MQIELILQAGDLSLGVDLKLLLKVRKAALIMAYVLKTLISPLLFCFKERLLHLKKRKMNLDVNKKLKGESWEPACGRVLL